MRETARLFPAQTLMQRAGQTDLMRARRIDPAQVRIFGSLVSIRDQAVLHSRNIQFPPGYKLEDFIESLNQRVFFWPGTGDGPIDYGIRHFQRYQAECPAILRVALQSMLSANPSVAPRFCRFNSGSPRCSHGRKSPRGPDVFLLTEDFSGTPSDVVEVTFDAEISIPIDSELGISPQGPWNSMFQ
jgi:hypothetical protein